MDFVEGLPKSEGYDAIMVVVDRFTKFAHFVPLRHPFTAAQVAKSFWDNIVKPHGVPASVVSDRDKVFTSALWRELLAGAGTKLLYSTAYHPQTDGQSERVNQCTEMYLRCAVHDTPRQWRKWLPSAEFWYDSSYHASLRCSPFKALYGVEANMGSMGAWQHTPPIMRDGEEWDWAMHTDNLRAQLERAQKRFKKYADINRTERSFQIGEQVLLKLQPHVQKSLASRPCAKLAYKFFGPFKILDKIGNLAYRLDLPQDSRIHPIFHISQLKPLTPNYSPVFSELPSTGDLTTVDTTPVAILDRRMMKRGNASVVQLHVQWDKPATATTWEDYDVLRRRFPAAPIWNHQDSSEDARSEDRESVT
uniref:Integrase catalytic domain-containing protein n=1 Tax=Triticum urartu TaxID=4572 RepID=A0A8R7VAA2_TRIUA